jgi:hypothetical protein
VDDSADVFATVRSKKDENIILYKIFKGINLISNSRYVKFYLAKICQILILFLANFAMSHSQIFSTRYSEIGASIILLQPIYYKPNKPLKDSVAT